jgi:type II secretory pathway component GspD/PulD (secretin)
VVTPADPATGTPAVLNTTYLDHEDDFAVGVNGPVAGPNGTRQFTPDLKIPFRIGNFGRGRPTNFVAGQGLNFGIAFLSDVEVSLFLEAAQANNRGNVLQAPKLTMVQSPFPSTVFSGTVEPFVTELNPVVSGNSVAFEPTIDQFFNGAGMSVSAVVSADRRYVRLNLVPFFNEITRVETFRIPAAAGGGGNLGGVGGSGVAIEAELRIPVIATNFVSTVVTVPDGGTILMGGLKTKTERRNEAGVPVLSKIPYINRLFTDTGVQSQTSSLLLMVTPRIIILEEEEDLLGKTLAF